MAGDDLENKKRAVDRYLDQIKILSALATALLLAPSILQVVSQRSGEASHAGGGLLSTRGLALCANISFLLVILLSYLIYSSLVGEIHRGTYNIYRSATRVLSLAQLALLALGLAVLTVVFFRIF